MTSKKNNTITNNNNNQSVHSEFDFLNLVLEEDDFPQLKKLKGTNVLPDWFANEDQFKLFPFDEPQEASQKAIQERKGTKGSSKKWQELRNICEKDFVLNSVFVHNIKLSQVWKESDHKWQSEFWQGSVFQQNYISEGLTSASSIYRLEFLCSEYKKLAVDRNVGGSWFVPKSLSDGINSTRTPHPSRADVSVGFVNGPQNNFGFRAGERVWCPFLVEEHKNSDVDSAQASRQLILYMIIALVGQQREIGPNLSVVYGAMQTGQILRVYRMIQIQQNKNGEITKPYILQTVAKWNLKEQQQFLQSVTFFKTLIEKSQNLLYELLSNTWKTARKSIEPQHPVQKSSSKRKANDPKNILSNQPKRNSKKNDDDDDPHGGDTVQQESSGAQQRPSKQPKSEGKRNTIAKNSQKKKAPQDTQLSEIEEMLLFPNEIKQDKVIWEQLIYDDSDMFGSQVYKVKFPNHPRLKSMKLVAKNQFWDKNIVREIKILHELADCPYVLPLVGVISRSNPTRHAALFPDMSEDRIDITTECFSLQQIYHFFAQLFKALIWIHCKGLIHGDLKPDNIIFTKKERLYIIDFGSAIPLGESLSSHNVAGTEGYMSPKIKGGKPAGVFMDMYACGVMLAEMLFDINCVGCTHEIVYQVLESKLSDITPDQQTACDLMYRLLESDNSFSAVNALAHPFFSVEDSCIEIE